MSRRARDDASGFTRARSWLATALGRTGLVLGAVLLMVAVLVLALLVLTWATGLGPELPGREHY
jgi:hypothetical protein